MWALSGIAIYGSLCGLNMYWFTKLVKMAGRRLSRASPGVPKASSEAAAEAAAAVPEAAAAVPEAAAAVFSAAPKPPLAPKRFLGNAKAVAGPDGGGGSPTAGGGRGGGIKAVGHVPAAAISAGPETRAKHRQLEKHAKAD